MLCKLNIGIYRITGIFGEGKFWQIGKISLLVKTKWQNGMVWSRDFMDATIDTHKRACEADTPLN